MARQACRIDGQLNEANAVMSGFLTGHRQLGTMRRMMMRRDADTLALISALYKVVAHVADDELQRRRGRVGCVNP
jgi:hypothetical protein